jgi:hypothetical protein
MFNNEITIKHYKNTYLLIHIRPINQPLTRIGMQPPPLSDTPNLHPNMIRQIQTIPRIEPNSSAVCTKQVGVLAATAAAGGKEGSGGIVAGKCCGCVAKLACVGWRKVFKKRGSK